MRFIPVIIIILLLGCNTNQEALHQNEVTYFDVSGYFKGEIQRLSARKMPVHKQVWINDTQENKDIEIKDWKTELSMFVNADINKTSWKGLFKEDKTGDSLIYTSVSTNIPVKKLIVEKVGTYIKGISIFINEDNYLYKKQDSLYYYPDSLYEINSRQRVTLLKEKRYKISGYLK
ncbi:hypothetical protein [Pedobacter montanisoli]|uniref:Uncharacterized protein n=1 Tax=Pedobacter montanisoli TaxID=2923277 RepID=A0ABS9ZZR9_9SPHI|nr:hypothetical protein [Pedobacter montanisoli]MCJ0743811.1 hypothetical protein [Pedobacter montanisoli]